MGPGCSHPPRAPCGDIPGCTAWSRLPRRSWTRPYSPPPPLLLPTRAVPLGFPELGGEPAPRGVSGGGRDPTAPPSPGTGCASRREHEWEGVTMAGAAPALSLAWAQPAAAATGETFPSSWSRAEWGGGGGGWLGPHPRGSGLVLREQPRGWRRKGGFPFLWVHPDLGGGVMGSLQGRGG